nr:MAG TPA: hypothetical protein [Caudoviricetes sp.]
MWTLNSRNECGTKHFRGISSDRDSIYGNSSTVQPPALVVNIWKRTA